MRPLIVVGLFVVILALATLVVIPRTPALHVWHGNALLGKPGQALGRVAAQDPNALRVTPWTSSIAGGVAFQYINVTSSYKPKVCTAQPTNLLRQESDAAAKRRIRLVALSPARLLSDTHVSIEHHTEAVADWYCESNTSLLRFACRPRPVRRGGHHATAAQRNGGQAAQAMRVAIVPRADF